jgi:dTMP kinase
MPQNSGKLISIEGGEGAGKTTVFNAIRQFLSDSGITVIGTREPGGTEVGERIRQVLLSPDHRIVPEAELLLMFASRAQLVQELVRPALAEGHYVLTDRFTDASFAYQGGGRGLPLAQIEALERDFVGIRPDLTLLLDLGVEQGMARAQARGQALDRIEQERTDFFQRVRETYRQRAGQEPERIVIIDASQPQDDVVRQVLAAVSRWMKA